MSTVHAMFPSRLWENVILMMIGLYPLSKWGSRSINIWAMTWIVLVFVFYIGLFSSDAVSLFLVEATHNLVLAQILWDERTLLYVASFVTSVPLQHKMFCTLRLSWYHRNWTAVRQANIISSTVSIVVKVSFQTDISFSSSWVHCFLVAVLFPWF